MFLICERYATSIYIFCLSIFLCFAAVGREVPAVPHVDELLGHRVPAAVRAPCMRLVVVAGQGGTDS